MNFGVKSNFMNDVKNYRAFHPHIALTYKHVHQWIADTMGTDQYQRLKKKNIRDKIKDDKFLAEETFLSAAAQYYVLFPAHFFKVTYTLENIINILHWLKHTSRICLVDIGCGAGSASAAFIDVVLDLRQKNLLSHDIEIFCIGVDPNQYAIVLYNQFMMKLKERVGNININLDYKVIIANDRECLKSLSEYLKEKRQIWQQPYLTHTLIMQVNVVSPFSKRYYNVRRNHDELKKLGLDTFVIDEQAKAFGYEESSAYKQLLEIIDRIHIVTVGTEGWENRVSEMAQAINSEFSNDSHIVERLGEGKHTVNYQLPEGCYWKEHYENSEYSADFYVDVSSVANKELKDKDWNKINDIENLRLAWARTRRHLLVDSNLTDEIEIRLFELDLDSNLNRLREQLIVYHEDIVPNDRVSFAFPKNMSTTRPLGLSRMEEEILSIAIIQQLGQKIMGLMNQSYAYRFSRNYEDAKRGGTEYLYEYYFHSHDKFLKDAQDAAQKHERCVVLRTDIKSFYTRIMQDQLLEMINDLTNSKRVQWLLRLLLLKNIDEHEIGRGIVQGSISSPFYANLYLLDIDNHFGANNEWEVKFFRYADDMIIIVPNPSHCKEILESLKTQLNKINLELNEDKTEIYENVSEFLVAIKNDDVLSKFRIDTNTITNLVFVTNSDYRDIFRKSYFGRNSEWEYYIELYQNCLKMVGIFFSMSDLSRKIYNYIFNQKKCESDLMGSQELVLPTLPRNIQIESLEIWSNIFKLNNKNWIKKRKELKMNLIEFFLNNCRTMLNGDVLNGNNQRMIVTRIRYSLNRLMELGLDEVRETVVEILCKMPWLLRKPWLVIESLARQNFKEEIIILLDFYKNETIEMNEYLNAVTLRSISFIDKLDIHLWNELALAATSNSVIISLLATEAWLKLEDKCLTFMEDSHINAIKNVLSSDPLPPSRLQKNYLLILGKYSPNSLNGITISNDFLTKNAHDIATEGNIMALFDYMEPDIIRKIYYSGKDSYLSSDSDNDQSL